MTAIAAESADGIANIEQVQRCCQAKIVLKKWSPCGSGIEFLWHPALYLHITKEEAPILCVLGRTVEG